MIQPLVWMVILMIMAIRSKSVITRKRLLIGSLIICYLFSNEFIFNKFALAWENNIPAAVLANDHFEVAIILGGISGYSDDRQQYYFNANSERILNVLPLYYSGKVDKLLITGGSGNLIQGKKEADILKEYLVSIKVKEDDILIENNSRNTRENAVNSVQLIKDLGIKGNVLLSTSALHMPRSYSCFQKIDFHPTPFPVDFISSSQNNYRFDKLFIPKPGVMNKWYWLFHEWVGLLSYKAMGYC